MFSDLPPSFDILRDRLRAFVEAHGLSENSSYIEWNSSVYSLVDCVFSAQSRYDSVVLPILRVRLPQRLEDTPELRLSDFLEDIDRFESDKFERYSSEVVKNRQKIAGRLKLEVAYDCARVLVSYQLETRQNFLDLGIEALEPLILEELVRRVRGIGPTLARYLLMLIGHEHHVKLDTLLIRLIARETGWTPRMGHVQDMQIAQDLIASLAAEYHTTAARLDNTLWLYESTRKGKASL